MPSITKVEIHFGDYPLKKPLKIASGVIRNVPQIFVTAEVRDGEKTVKGYGHNGYSIVWADRREMALAEKDRQVREYVKIAARELSGFAFSTPFDFYRTFVLQNATALPQLAYTMALSPIDLAIWDAYARIYGVNVFRLPEVNTRMDFEEPQKVKVIHLVDMDETESSIREAISNEGVSIFKIKLGGNPREDALRARTIAAIGGVKKAVLDVNEAYRSAGELEDFANYLGEDLYGAVLFIEQPFLRTSGLLIEKSKIKIPLFADESYAVHTDIKKLHELGYGGAALKPHTKTFSGTLLALDELRKLKMAYAVMDLTTAPPVGYLVGAMTGALLNVAGGVELNGRQYYQSWDNLVAAGFPAGHDAFTVRGGTCDVSEFFGKPGWGIDAEEYSRYLQPA